MDMRFDEEQQMMQEAFTDFFTSECPSSLVRQLEEGSGHSPEIWSKLANIGGMSINLPEDFGGLGGTFMNTVLLYEAMGRNLYPSPHLWTVVVAADLILRLGTEEQKSALLSKIAGGELLVTLALTEKEKDNPKDFVVEMRPDGDCFLLSGQKHFVEFAAHADYILVVSRSESGISLGLIPSDRKGISWIRQDEIGKRQFYRVDLKDVIVNKDEMLGPENDVLDILNTTLDRARVALAARMLGGCQAAFDLTLKYSKEREQFGQRIAMFQNISFRLAEMQTRIDGARLLLYRTAWLVDQNAPFSAEAAMVKALVGDLSRHVTAEAMQIHGGFGITEEADPQLYYRNTAVDAVLLGSAFQLRDIVADTLDIV
jgi:alkylation response protein AidB-like acyl-CoA dehydrogenase